MNREHIPDLPGGCVVVCVLAALVITGLIIRLAYALVS